MKLTKRDKSLLFFLVLFIACIVIIKFLILPAYKEYKTTMQVVNQNSDIIEEINIAKASIESKRNEIRNLESVFITSAKDYYPLMTKKEIHELINNILVISSIYPTDFAINEPVLLELENESSLIYSSEVSINAVGNYEKIKYIIDYFNNIASIQIENFSITGAAQGKLNNTLDAEFSIEIILYMYDGVE